MKKQLVLLVLLLCLISILCGCSNKVEYKSVSNKPGRFVTVEKIASAFSNENTYYLIVDRETRVLYLWKEMGITPVFNQDGTLAIYEGELE